MLALRPIARPGIAPPRSSSRQSLALSSRVLVAASRSSDGERRTFCPGACHACAPCMCPTECPSYGLFLRAAEASPASRNLLEAFFIGRAFGEVVNERLGAAAGDALADLGRLDAETRRSLRCAAPRSYVPHTFRCVPRAQARQRVRPAGQRRASPATTTTPHPPTCTCMLQGV